MASRKVLLVGWDAADWKVIRPLMAAGKMPNVRRLVADGASGQIATLHPALSPMLWTSIATGKRPFQHGIHGFTEPTPDGRGVQPITNLSRKSKALWNILNQNQMRSIVIGWWPSHPAEPITGVMVSDAYHRAAGPLDEGWPLPDNTVHPPQLAHTLAGLRVHPDSLEPSIVEPFIPDARNIDQEQDKRLAMFLRTLAECMTIHSAATWLLDNQPWDFFAVYYEAIDHFCHSFMRYHPPRQSWIAERDFNLYRNVVSMAYQFHDQMLATLLSKAGEDTTVILMSDHGFHPDHMRPTAIPDVPAGPAVEHRELGVFAIRGEGVKKAEPVYGISVLDVAPTILTLYGLPVGEDMDGKVLSQAFVELPQVAYISSWEEVPGADGRHPPHTRFDPVAAHAALEQMIALGYIQRPGENTEVAVAKTIREQRFNLAEAYQDAGRHFEAFEILKQLYDGDPLEQRFAVRLFVSCQALAMHKEMRLIVEHLEAGPKMDRRVTSHLKAQVLIAEKRYADALAALESVTETNLQTADLYLRLGRTRQARQVCERVLAVDPDNTHAHLALCRIALRQRKFSVAAQAALEALERIHHDPRGHFLLGRALAGMRDYERAADAFRAALSFNPNFPEAHVALARLLERHLDDADSARGHRRLARRMRAGGTVAAVRADAELAIAVPDSPPAPPAALPPVDECLIVITGLPRSGTSMLMQMIRAGGLEVISDESRAADEDNPRGYLEFEPVRNLMKSAQWLDQARGKAIKIVAPLLSAIPPDLACRVILCERDLDEVLDSQERMLANRTQPSPVAPERRNMLKEEYARTLSRVKAMLAGRLLIIQHSRAISDPAGTAAQINSFLGGGLNVAKMSAAVEPALHRQRRNYVRIR